MTNLHSRDILKSRDITLPTKVHLVKTMVFPGTTDIFPGQIDGQQTRKKMLNIINHEENAKQNHSEISPHTCQNA